MFLKENNKNKNTFYGEDIKSVLDIRFSSHRLQKIINQHELDRFGIR